MSEINVGDIVLIDEKDSNTFYGIFKEHTGLGIVTDLRRGYSMHSLYWVRVVMPINTDDDSITFYDDDLTKVDISQLTKEAIDAIMVDML